MTQTHHTHTKRHIYPIHGMCCTGSRRTESETSDRGHLVNNKAHPLLEQCMQLRLQKGLPVVATRVRVSRFNTAFYFTRMIQNCADDPQRKEIQPTTLNEEYLKPKANTKASKNVATTTTTLCITLFHTACLDVVWAQQPLLGQHELQKKTSRRVTDEMHLIHHHS